MTSSAVLLQVEDLRVAYPSKSGTASRETSIDAVRGVSFEIRSGEALGLVGESGSGKTSVARGVLQLIRPSGGEVVFDGEPLTQHWCKRFGQWTWNERLRELRSKMQVIFQDPKASLNPRRTVFESVAEPLKNFSRTDRASLRDRVVHLLGRVELSADYADRYPHELSGGQGQRVVIARALALEPRLLVADEPVSALDASIQGQILNLLKSLQREFNMSLLYISHDLSTVRHMCDRVCVLAQGQIVETNDVNELFSAAVHPHTQALIRAIPRLP